jgi:hypothetical protein
MKPSRRSISEPANLPVRCASASSNMVCKITTPKLPVKAKQGRELKMGTGFAGLAVLSLAPAMRLAGDSFT